jgi:lipoprotein-releasing system ATP-binding protein
MAKKTPAIEARALHKSFQDADRSLKVLRGADLSVYPGEAVAIVGVSGSGKSTLLHILAGLDQPTKGQILLNGNPYSVSGTEASALERARSIGIVYQFHHLLPEFNALENIMLPGLVAGLSASEARKRAEERLAEAGLADRAGHRPAKLSGGERQRVAIARALMNDPALVLADEPTGNLDAETARESTEMLWKSTLEKGRALIIVTHEPSIASKAGRIFSLEKGRLVDRTERYKNGQAFPSK